MHLAARMSRLGTETAFQVLAEAKALESEGKDIVHLEIGEPDLDTSGHIVESAIQALRDGWHHYTPQKNSAGTERNLVLILCSAAAKWQVSVQKNCSIY